MPNANVAARKLVPLVVFEIALTLLVILGGAFVRASGSGAGCGEHWPLCNGQAIPFNPRFETVIEYTHRLTSGLSLVVFVVLFFLVRARVPANHPARAWSCVALVSFVGEALIGAFLVLKNLVAANASVMRAIVIATHLVNTYVLLAGLLGIFWALRDPETPRPSELSGRARFILVIWCLVGAIGAIVALGDTLFPAATLLQGITQDVDPGAHFLVRLRFVHPVVAILAAVLTLGQTFRARSTPEGRAVRLLILAQLVCGLTNWLLLAPYWLQLTHLLLADLNWLAVVAFFLA